MNKYPSDYTKLNSVRQQYLCTQFHSLHTVVPATTHPGYPDSRTICHPILKIAS